MLTHEVVSARGGVLWLGAYERGEPVPDVSKGESLVLGIPGALFADLLAGHHLTADHQSLVRYEITGGRALPHGHVTITVRIVGERMEFVEIASDQIVAQGRDTLDLLVPNLGEGDFLAFVADSFVVLRCMNREFATAPQWSWTTQECQWWVARFSVRPTAEYLNVVTD